jgi:hypothetical protein
VSMMAPLRCRCLVLPAPDAHLLSLAADRARPPDAADGAERLSLLAAYARVGEEDVRVGISAGCQSGPLEGHGGTLGPVESDRN